MARTSRSIAWFGYDEANFTTGRDGKKLLRELHDLSPVPVYIRAHHLLTSGDGVPELKWSSTNVYREDANGKPVYDFTILDGIFDEYKAAGVVPMVELGFMPKDLTSGTNAYQVHYPGRTTGGSVQAPPKDYSQMAGAGAGGDGASGAALWRARRCEVVFRSLERAGHRLLARHAGAILGAL